MSSNHGLNRLLSAMRPIHDITRPPLGIGGHALDQNVNCLSEAATQPAGLALIPTLRLDQLRARNLSEKQP
jgi:hypothetical protein